MISKEDVVPLLWEACPSFKPILEAERETYWDDSDWLLYPVVGLLAAHIIELFQRGVMEEVVAYFSLAERLCVEGNEYVQELATVGLLEDIQNHALNNSIALDSFLSFLGPQSGRRWKELIEFWGQVQEPKQKGLIPDKQIDLSKTSPGFRKRFGNLSRPHENPDEHSQ
jgi:hypothetical protein